MHYTVRHTTTIEYSQPIRQSIMEVRKQPRTEGAQRCLFFRMDVEPHAHVLHYRDPLGTAVHHFDIPGPHRQVVIRAEALVELRRHLRLPDAVPLDAWDDLDRLAAHPAFWEFLAPSRFATPGPELQAFSAEVDLRRDEDPLTLVQRLNSAIFRTFEYAPRSTRVDSPIADALRNRMGVCQDFAHVMIALLREVGVPSRYVSGYLFHRNGYEDRSAHDASHAWIEAFIPGPGWVGLDPTNDVVADERHIRVAVGRDYSDVPPTRGVYTGNARSTIAVEVQVVTSPDPIPETAPSPLLPPSAAGPPLQTQSQ